MLLILFYVWYDFLFIYYYFDELSCFDSDKEFKCFFDVFKLFRCIDVKKIKKKIILMCFGMKNTLKNTLLYFYLYWVRSGVFSPMMDLLHPSNNMRFSHVKKKERLLGRCWILFFFSVRIKIKIHNSILVVYEN
jgi:hypothetical protein